MITIEEGNLSKEIIINMEVKLTEMNELLSKSEIKYAKDIQKQWSSLIETIFNFTKDFAEANSYIVEDLEFIDEGVKSNLIRLEDYLRIQKDIFKKMKLKIK